MNPEMSMNPALGSAAAVPAAERSADAAAPPRGAARVPELDGLRGLAIGLVIFHHLIVNSIYPRDCTTAKIVAHIFSLSWSGVDLFFVLSGFLIGGILMDNRGSETYYRSFYGRRVCRIFPLYYAWIALAWLLPMALSAFSLESWYYLMFSEFPPFWSHLVFLQNVFMARHGLYGTHFLGGTWSLAVEEQFYLTLPLIIRYVSPKKLPRLLLLLLAAVPLLRLGVCFLFTRSMQANYTFMPCRADALLLGALCAWVVREPAAREWFKQRTRLLHGALAVFFAGMIAITVWFDARNKVPMMFFGYTAIALFYACLLLTVVTSGNGFLSRCFRFGPLCRMGLIAYGLYMIHEPLNCLLHGLIFARPERIADLNTLLVTAAGFGLSFYLAKASWLYFEKPIIAWGYQRFKQRNTAATQIKS
jgi:peptidoglycan/LPS O-acetylase OafA/YrhL